MATTKKKTRALCYEYNKELNKTSQLMPTVPKDCIQGARFANGSILSPT